MNRENTDTMMFYYQQGVQGDHYYLFHRYFIEGVYHPCTGAPYICRLNSTDHDLIDVMPHKSYLKISKEVYHRKLIEALGNQATEVIVM